MDHTLHICLTTDQNYLELTEICINEIILHKDPSTEIVFYILGNNVDLSILQKFERYPGISIVLYAVDFNQIVSKDHTNRYLSNTMYFRILIPTLDIFKDVEKVLYLDSDVLARKDLSEYYNTDISQVALGVIKDFGCANVFNDQPVDLKKYTYFYSGQLLMNLPRLKEINFSKRCLDILNQIHQPDQPIINKVIGTDVVYLDPKYCFSWHKTFTYKGNYCNIYLWNKTYGTNYKSIQDLTDSSVIWHFHGDKHAQRQVKVLNDLYLSSLNRVKQFLGGNE